MEFSIFEYSRAYMYMTGIHCRSQLCRAIFSSLFSHLYSARGSVRQQTPPDACPFPLVFKVSLVDVCFRSRVSTSRTPEGPADQRAPFTLRKNFSAAEEKSSVATSPRLPLLLSPALRHWRATLIIRYRSGEQPAGGRRGRRSSKGGKQEGPGTKRVARCSANISR